MLAINREFLSVYFDSVSEYFVCQFEIVDQLFLIQKVHFLFQQFAESFNHSEELKSGNLSGDEQIDIACFRCLASCIGSEKIAVIDLITVKDFCTCTLYFIKTQYAVFFVNIALFFKLFVKVSVFDRVCIGIFPLVILISAQRHSQILRAFGLREMFFLSEFFERHVFQPLKLRVFQFKTTQVVLTKGR